MARQKTADTQWKSIQNLFPSLKATGRPPTDCRLVLEASLRILRTAHFDGEEIDNDLWSKPF